MSLDPGFTTGASLRVFSHQTRVQRMLDVESALAAAQASAGLIPQAAAAAIAHVAHASEFDCERVLSDGWDVGTPLLPLVARLRELVDEPHRQFVHHATTTQDIVDTAAILQIREGILAVEGRWLQVGTALSRLADRHRATPMVGRSFLQAGGTITFGRKVAGWLSAVAGDLKRLSALLAELPVQVGGAMGVLAGMGERGPVVAAGLGERLGLVAPALPWHVDRWPIRSTAGAVGEVAATARLIATDTILLAQTGIEEVEVRAGQSSAIPGKRNPIDAIRANAAAQFAAVQAGGLLTIGPYEHERSTGAWHAEWALIPTMFHGALAAAEAVERAVVSMEVSVDRMQANLDATGLDHTDTGMASAMVDEAIAAFRDASP